MLYTLLPPSSRPSLDTGCSSDLLYFCVSTSQYIYVLNIMPISFFPPCWWFMLKTTLPLDMMRSQLLPRFRGTEDAIPTRVKSHPILSFFSLLSFFFQNNLHHFNSLTGSQSGRSRGGSFRSRASGGSINVLSIDSADNGMPGLVSAAALLPLLLCLRSSRSFLFSFFFQKPPSN